MKRRHHHNVPSVSFLTFLCELYCVSSPAASTIMVLHHTSPHSRPLTPCSLKENICRKWKGWFRNPTALFYHTLFHIFYLSLCPLVSVCLYSSTGRIYLLQEVVIPILYQLGKKETPVSKDKQDWLLPQILRGTDLCCSQQGLGGDGGATCPLSY